MLRWSAVAAFMTVWPDSLLTVSGSEQQRTTFGRSGRRQTRKATRSARLDWVIVKESPTVQAGVLLIFSAATRPSPSPGVSTSLAGQESGRPRGPGTRSPELTRQ